YNKGAEIVRMIETQFGKAGFRKGMDLYFKRHDGQAVTIEDFVAAMADANGADLSHFLRWYKQAGTPALTIEDRYDASSKTYELTIAQTTPPTPGQAEKEPLVVPLAMGLIGPDGAELPTRLDGEAEAKRGTRLLVLHDTDPFARWEAAQQVATELLLGLAAAQRAGNSLSLDPDLIEEKRRVL